MRASVIIDAMRRESYRMITYQDFSQLESEEDKAAVAMEAIRQHRNSRDYQIACDADLYDRQMNKTINEYVQFMFNATGSKLVDYTASNSKIASNFFERLNTQRCMYSLGNGVSFVGKDADPGEEDTVKKGLGPHFDYDLRTAAYYALIHGVCFGFWNVDRLYIFPITEFVPIWDEENGTLRAGIRFWRLDPSRPLQAIIYEEDGFTRLSCKDSRDEHLEIVDAKRNYVDTVVSVPAENTEQVIASDNYSSLPVVPIWGSRKHQSTLIGMRQSIDSYDLIRSGFANDLHDCAQIYWLVANAGGMSEADLAKFRDNLKFHHIANVDADAGESVQPYTQEPPYQARKQYLDDIRAQLYEDFGALDVHTVAAGATNDHIDAAYQPLDENAADFEYQVSEFVQQILSLQGIEAQPVFKRNRISNQTEQVSMVVQEAQWLDQETILRKLPNIAPEEVNKILEKVNEEDMQRSSLEFAQPNEVIEVEDGANEEPED